MTVRESDLHFFGRVTFLLTILILLICVKAYAGTATINTDAEYHVQRNSVEVFCASHVNVNGGTLNFTGPDCGGPTPPPAGLYASGRLSYGGRGGFITNANLLDWAVLFGRTGVQSDPVPFPGASGATPVWTPGANQYTCSKFRTGAAGSVSGQYKNSAYYSTGTINMSLSTSCGDFAPAQFKCHKENVPNNDQPALFWDINGAGSFKCHLPANTDVFLNVRRTSPTAQLAISVIGQQG